MDDIRVGSIRDFPELPIQNKYRKQSYNCGPDLVIVPEIKISGFKEVEDRFSACSTLAEPQRQTVLLLGKQFQFTAK